MKNHQSIVAQQRYHSAFPYDTGRYLSVITNNNEVSNTVRVALIGDSTIDNGYWVQKDKPYIEKTETVNYQIASHLALPLNTNINSEYQIANFAVDGANSYDLIPNNLVRMNAVLPKDADHPDTQVCPSRCASEFGPDIVVVSVGGNDYRNALNSHHGLVQKTGILGFFLCQTPEDSKLNIRTLFESVKDTLLQSYQLILEPFLNNDKTKRIIVSTQYYPELGSDTPYFIYTGLTHVAHAYDKTDHLDYTKELMEELYSEVYKFIKYNNPKNKEIIIADMTSSINPLENNHVSQIEPNQRGAKLIGKLLAHAISYNFDESYSDSSIQSKIAHFKLSLDGLTIDKVFPSDPDSFVVRHLTEFITYSRHAYFFPNQNDTMAERIFKTYYTFAGRRLNPQNSFGYEFGIVDLTVMPIFARFLWQYTLDEKPPIAIRILTGLISAPLLITSSVVAICLTTTCLPIIFGLHLITIRSKQDEPAPSRELCLDQENSTYNAIHSNEFSINTNMATNEIEHCHVNHCGNTVYHSDTKEYINKFVSVMDMDGTKIIEKNPEMFECPITRKIMHDPVITPDGNTYERKAIEQWVSRYGTDPLSRKSLNTQSLRKNNLVKDISNRFIKKMPRSSIDINQEHLSSEAITKCLDTFKDALGSLLPLSSNDQSAHNGFKSI